MNTLSYLVFLGHQELESIAHNGCGSLMELGKVSRKKDAVLLDFVQMRGGEGPAQTVCHLFLSAFMVNKRRVFPPKCQ